MSLIFQALNKFMKCQNNFSWLCKKKKAQKKKFERKEKQKLETISSDFEKNAEIFHSFVMSLKRVQLWRCACDKLILKCHKFLNKYFSNSHCIPQRHRALIGNLMFISVSLYFLTAMSCYCLYNCGGILNASCFHY